MMVDNSFRTGISLKGDWVDIHSPEEIGPIWGSPWPDGVQEQTGRGLPDSPALGDFLVPLSFAGVSLGFLRVSYSLGHF